jgi:hypothetical protein
MFGWLSEIWLIYAPLAIVGIRLKRGVFSQSHKSSSGVAVSPHPQHDRILW